MSNAEWIVVGLFLTFMVYAVWRELNRRKKKKEPDDVYSSSDTAGAHNSCFDSYDAGGQGGDSGGTGGSD